MFNYYNRGEQKTHKKNLSNKEFTNDQINLLAKGLKSIPTPMIKQTQIRQQLLRDFDQFARRMLACEQALLFGRAKRVSRERAFSRGSPK